MFLLDTPISLAYALVNGLSELFAPFAGELAATAAIVAFTVAVRLLLIPLAVAQGRGERSRRELAPKVERLKRRYGKNPKLLQEKTAELYRAESGTLLAGCLPALAQAPFFVVMYRLFVSATVAGHQNLLLTHTLLAAPLGQNFVSVAGAGLFAPPALVFLALFALLTAVAWVTARRVPADAPMGGVLRVLPFATVVFAAFVPLAAGVYLLVSGAWTAAERGLLHRRIVAPAG